MECSGIGDHRQIDRRYRPAKTGIRHVARSAGLVPEGRNVQVKIQQLAEYFYGLGSAAPQYRRIAC